MRNFKLQNMRELFKISLFMLKTGHREVHLGTAFHLAERCGANVQYEQLP